MLSYETCLKLKKLGFPDYGGDNGLVYVSKKVVMTWKDVAQNARSKYNKIIPNEDVVRIPTLSELIEKCGKGVQLSWYESGFTVKKWSHFDSVIAEVEWFDTPEEAVAELYCELRKRGII